MSFHIIHLSVRQGTPLRRYSIIYPPTPLQDSGGLLSIATFQVCDLLVCNLLVRITPNGLMCTTGICITNPSQSHCFHQILRDYLWVAVCWQVALCQVTGHLSVTETNYTCQYVMLKLLVRMWLQRGMTFSKHQLGTYSLQLVGYSKRRSCRVSIWGLTCNQSGRYGLTPCFLVGLSRG